MLGYSELNNSETARAIYAALPIKVRANLWGEEIYFEIPIKCKAESPKEIVSIGDLGYWLEGSCFCIFFGKTPISESEEIKPASAVNIFGKITNNTELLKKIKQNDEIKQMNQERKFFNVRDVSDYLYCARKAYLKLVVGKREPANSAMIAGRIIHEILDEFSKLEPDITSGIIRKMSSKELENLFSKHIEIAASRIFQKNEQIASSFNISQEEITGRIMQKLKRDLSKRIPAITRLLNKNIFGNQLWQHLEPKFLTELRIESEKYGLVGKIDKVMISKEGYIPYEVKNSEASNPHKSDLLQLAAYALLLEEHFKTKISRGVLEYKNQEIEIEISEELKQDVLNIISCLNMLNEKNIPPITEKLNKCRACGLRGECYKEG